MIRSDKELIELAAKAAGIVILGYFDCGSVRSRAHSDVKWNPLESREDAAMVEKALSLDVTTACGVVQVSKPYRHNVIELFDTQEQRSAAICRAITRAAAEIGAGIK